LQPINSCQILVPIEVYTSKKIDLPKSFQ